MMARRWLVAASCITLLLTACGPKSQQDIAEELKEAVTLINYMDRPGHGTGFFVRGAKDVCTVVTAGHVVEHSNNLQLQTVDGKLWETSNIESFPDYDLAVVTFAPEGKTWKKKGKTWKTRKNCPYRALQLGDSDQVKEGDTIYIRGFPAEEARRGVTQFSEGTVSAIRPPILEGYSISYDAMTAKGMSGAPVVNVDGQVIAVHGRTSTEIIRMANSPQSNLSLAQKAEVEKIYKTFGWGVPINIYKEEKSKIDKAERLFKEGLEKFNNAIYEEALKSYEFAIIINPYSPEYWDEQGIALEAEQWYKEAIADFDKAIEIKPYYYQAWHKRGEALVSLGKSDEAIASFDKAIKIKRDYYQAWHKRGEALVSLGKHYEAIASFDKAIEIKRDYYEAWHNRGEALVSLGKHYEAIGSFDKAIEINPEEYQAWNKRGEALVSLKRYYEAIADFDEAIKIKHDYSEAWNNRGWALENLERYDKALESYDKAIKYNNQTAIYNRKNLLEKLERPTQ